MKFKLFALALISAVALVTSASVYAEGNGSMKEDSGMQEGSATGGQQLSSDTVKQAQDALNQQGYEIGSTDGQMGEKTQDAIKKFQQDKGLEASGQLDSETLAALGVSPEGAAAGGVESDEAGKSDSMNSSGSMQDSESK